MRTHGIFTNSRIFPKDRSFGEREDPSFGVRELAYMSYTKRLPTALRKSLALVHPPVRKSDLVFWQLEHGRLKAVKYQLYTWLTHTMPRLINTVMRTEHENVRIMRYVVSNMNHKSLNDAVRYATNECNLLALSCLVERYGAQVSVEVGYNVLNLLPQNWSALFWWYLEAIRPSYTVRGYEDAWERVKRRIYTSIPRAAIHGNEFINMVMDQIEIAEARIGEFTEREGRIGGR